jgi:hypothetical protein
MLPASHAAAVIMASVANMMRRPDINTGTQLSGRASRVHAPGCAGHPLLVRTARTDEIGSRTAYPASGALG